MSLALELDRLDYTGGGQTEIIGGKYRDVYCLSRKVGAPTSGY